MPGILARRGNAVVATGAGPCHLAVVDGTGLHRHPAGREFLMAGIAHITAGNVCRTLARRCGTVMAADAVTTEAAVIHDDSGYPRAHAVAAVAVQRGDHVGRAFAGGDDTVMTTGTGTQHLGVIHGTGRYRQPTRELSRRVAGITHVTGVDMAGWQVMTTGTDTRHLVVIHGGRGHWRP